MQSFHTLLQALLLAAPFLSHVTAQIHGVCDPADTLQPNPIGKKAKYRNYATTGTINGSVVILPINYTLARSIVPAEYPILKAQYEQWLPFFHKDKYPMMLQMELFHDLYHNGKAAGSSADFLRASVSFPFVDRLNDGYTAMTYNHEIIISDNATAAQAQFASYGSVVAPGFFASCNPYEYENATANLALPPAKRGIDQAAWADTNTNLGNPSIAYRLTPAASSPYPTDFWYNVTSQPLFSDTTTYCDNAVRLSTTAVTTGAYVPVAMKGTAAVLKPFFQPKSKTEWSGVYGLKLDQAYYEKPKATCSKLQGFSVVNAP